MFRYLVAGALVFASCGGDEAPDEFTTDDSVPFADYACEQMAAGTARGDIDSQITAMLRRADVSAASTRADQAIAAAEAAGC